MKVSIGKLTFSVSLTSVKEAGSDSSEILPASHLAEILLTADVCLVNLLWGIAFFPSDIVVNGPPNARF